MTENLFPYWLADARRVAQVALAEDGAQDITSIVSVNETLTATGVIEGREGGVFAGRLYAEAVAEAAGAGAIHWKRREGERYAAGDVLGTLTAPLRPMLRAERPLLNLLQRAGGIAGATRRYVDAIEGTKCRVLHTRKTAPGLRLFDVAAVIAGGGVAHRLDLEYTVMIKDNHWAALHAEHRTLADALAAARARGVHALLVEVETATQVDEACAAGATRLMVDNQTPEIVKSWGARAREARPGIEIEATGGITLGNVREYAAAGADYVSVGALTHSVRAADIALEVEG